MAAAVPSAGKRPSSGGNGGDAVVVAVRVRPPRSVAAADGQQPQQATVCVSAGETPGAVVTTDTSAERCGKQLQFVYSRAFFEACSTREVYDAVGRAVLEQSLRGYNTSLLAYGQTGTMRRPRRGPGPGAGAAPRCREHTAHRRRPTVAAATRRAAAELSPALCPVSDASLGTRFPRCRAGSGKTHTCFGAGGEPGLVQLLAEELFARLEALPAARTWTVQLAILEIYNERRASPPRLRPPPRASRPPSRVRASPPLIST